jgi:tetratricopeptide (TPR) repeat protein
MLMQRRAAFAVALMGALSAPAILSAQARQLGPAPDTPRLLVMVFSSSDRATGVQQADALRSRVSTNVDVRRLYVIPKNDITMTLQSSGFNPDSALGLSDLKELAKLLRADEVLAGQVSRTATGVHVEPRLMLARDISVAQALPAVEAPNVGEAAKQIERSLGEARKQLPENKDCENFTRDKQYDKAIAAARSAIAKYPNGTIARLCLANVYAEEQTAATDSVKKMALADTVLTITSDVSRLDPLNASALRLAYAAYQVKHDPEHGVLMLVKLSALDPQNISLQNQVVNELALLGKPSAALAIVDTLLARNPGDPQLLRQNWLLSLKAAAADSGTARLAYLKRALDAGEQMTKIDTVLADSVFFERQIAAASAVTDQPQRAVEFASRATQKFSNSVNFWMARGNAERKAGQLQMAQQSLSRALSLDAGPRATWRSRIDSLRRAGLSQDSISRLVPAPASANANLLLAQVALDMQQPDSALAVARRAVAEGEDAKTWGSFLLAPTQKAFQAAQQSKASADYQRALTLAQEADRLNATPTSKFFIGVSAFSLGIDALQQAQKPKSCPLAKQAQDMFLLTQTNMPAGGAVDANVAKQILGYVAQYSPAADQMVKTYCK